MLQMSENDSTIMVDRMLIIQQLERAKISHIYWKSNDGADWATNFGEVLNNGCIGKVIFQLCIIA